jgi:ferrous iron transport protein B
MAARTIEHPKDRLVTILVAPLMSCSARLPVYTLLIAACIPDRLLWGFLPLPGLTLFGLYALGILAAFLLAWAFKKTLLQGHTPLLILELPPYRRPLLATLLRHMWDRASLFLRRAGTVILGINILLWFLASYPHHAGDHAQAGERLRGSFVGQFGRLIEPVIRPLGFDWKIGIGIVASFAAREVFVSTMSVVYSVGDGPGAPDNRTNLAQTLREQKHPDGTPVYTTLTGVTLMVFYVAALQCVSTVAVVRRETNSWKWPLFQWACLGALAWLMAFLTYQGGRLLGFR